MLEAEQSMNAGKASIPLNDGLTIRQNFADIVNALTELGISVGVAEEVINADMNGDGMAYDDFCALTLEGGYTPANEQWLVEMLTNYPDVTLIVDAKMDTTLLDAEVIKRVYALEEIYGIELSDRVIPEVFSVEMWDAIKDTTDFDKHLFSRYKVCYDIDITTDNFTTDKFIGVALSYNGLDDYYKRSIPYLQSLGYRIFMFGINNAEDTSGALEIGADTVYVDGTDDLP
jgi:hypothetical protein